MPASSYRVELGPMAGDDAEAAFRWFLKRNPLHAVEWYDGLAEAIDSLAHHPTRCAIAPENARRKRGIRQLPFTRGKSTIRILFVVNEDKGVVHVLRIRHGARRRLRWKELLPDEE